MAREAEFFIVIWSMCIDCTIYHFSTLRKERAKPSPVRARLKHVLLERMNLMIPPEGATVPQKPRTNSRVRRVKSERKENKEWVKIISMTTPLPASSAGVPHQKGRGFDQCPCRSDMSLAAVRIIVAHSLPNKWAQHPVAWYVPNGVCVGAESRSLPGSPYLVSGLCSGGGARISRRPSGWSIHGLLLYSWTFGLLGRWSFWPLAFSIVLFFAFPTVSPVG